MIGINGKSWNDLSIDDIVEFLNGDTNETFFFEFKSDKENTKGVIKEISAFANTYGGYIFIGVEDNKEISGCKEWTEEKVHNIMHNCITPTPTFDVKQFKTKNNSIIIIIKIEEGNMPPYITNSGHIYERVSSGSFPIKESAKLNQLYYKKEDRLHKIENKLKIPDINLSTSNPFNLCGYLDIGFHLTYSEPEKIFENFYNLDLTAITSFLNDEAQINAYGISKLGMSYIINLGAVNYGENDRKSLLNAGMYNFMDVMFDGSVKLRMLLCSDIDDIKTDVSSVIFSFMYFSKIYSLMIDSDFYNHFISVHKYEKLTVLKQFVPYFKDSTNVGNGWENHNLKYGRNQIIIGGRMPLNGFNIIDRRTFGDNGVELNNDILIRQLFMSNYFGFGFVDFGKNKDDIS